MDNHEPGRPSPQASRVPTVVFYDIMHEAATRVRGALVGLYDDGVIDQEQSLRASLAVAERVDRVPPEDRGAIIHMTTRLRAYSARLEARGRSRERPVAIDLRW
ncbi:hypothetical protein JOE53_001093 [Microbacterium laevaniformans]|nr:hypothetical protein [Microbacterium laevaniformans]GLJ64910.1 hypothetical protein GCM10017578_17990 [Microbacterium laevaniformans]